MRSLSFWAKNNRPIAITILVITKILLVLLAYSLGRILQGGELVVPAWVYYVSIFFFVAGAVAYPASKKSKTASSGRYHYWRRKTCDVVMSICCFVMITTLVNSNFGIVSPSNISASNAPGVRPTAEEILASLAHRDKSSLTKMEKRILKKEFKKQLKLYAKAKITGKKKDADKSLLIILTIVAALGLLYLVAALSCGLACNGAEGAATLVAILGVVGVVIGTIFVIRAINRRDRKRREYAPKPDSSI